MKAVSKVIDEHRAQILNYLNACQMQLGLLINFGHYPKLEYEQFANSRPRKTRNDAKESKTVGKSSGDDFV